MMLPDMFLRDEDRYRLAAEEFRDDQEMFWREFAAAFKQLTEAGMEPEPRQPVSAHEPAAAAAAGAAATATTGGAEVVRLKTDEAEPVSLARGARRKH